jgi:hypothetical protein
MPAVKRGIERYNDRELARIKRPAARARYQVSLIPKDNSGVRRVTRAALESTTAIHVGALTLGAPRHWRH